MGDGFTSVFSFITFYRFSAPNTVISASGLEEVSSIVVTTSPPSHQKKRPIRTLLLNAIIAVTFFFLEVRKLIFEFPLFCHNCVRTDGTVRLGSGGCKNIEHVQRDFGIRERGRVNREKAVTRGEVERFRVSVRRRPVTSKRIRNTRGPE